MLERRTEILQRKHAKETPVRSKNTFLLVFPPSKYVAQQMSMILLSGVSRLLSNERRGKWEMKTNWGSHATLILSLRSKSLELYYETPKATTHLCGNNQAVQAFPIKFPSSYLTIVPALFLMLCYTWLFSSRFIPALQTLCVTALFVLQCCQQSSNPRVAHSFVFELVPPCLTVWEKKGPKQKAVKEMVVFLMFNRKKACEGTWGAQRQNNWRKSHSPLPFYKKEAGSASCRILIHFHSRFRSNSSNRQSH